MEISEVVCRVLVKLGWDAELCMNPNSHKHTKKISAGMLINSIISTDTIKDGRSL